MITLTNLTTSLSKMHFSIMCGMILLLLAFGECFFSNPLKKLKQKAKSIYNKKFGKDKTWHFLGHDLTEYPGTNAEYRKINKAKWEEYYECLQQQNANLGAHLSATPEAVQGFQGGSIKFACKICLSPSESAQIDSVEWYWGAVEATKLELVEYTEHTLLSPEEKTLHIYNLQPEHSGQYMCQMGDALVAPYFLTVVNNSENLMRDVHVKQSGKQPQPMEPVKIDTYNLIVDTEWGPWSPCSKCDQIGKKHRLGYCTVGILETKSDEKMLNEKGPKNQDSGEITEIDLELLRIFKYGIPCQSHILPESVQKLPDVQDRKDEIMTAFCKVKCPENQVFEVKDKKGNVIEVANNTAGVYSMLQGPPPAEPSVERMLLYGVKGLSVEIACPGNLNSDAPLQWQIGSKNVIPELLAQQTNGRMYVSITDKIHIKKAKKGDSDIYSCWQEKELAGTVRLVIEKKIVMNFNHHIMLGGIVIILSTFLYVYVRAFFGKKHAKI